MIHLIHKRVFNMLQRGDCRVTVECSPGGMEALGLPTRFLTLDLSLNPAFLPNMNLQLDDDGFEAELKIYNNPRQMVRVLWPSVRDAEQLPGRPNGGGTKISATA